MFAGGGERPDRRHPLHHERAAGLPDLLAHLQHHGRQPFRREVRPLRQPDRLRVRRLAHQQPVRMRRRQRHLTALLDQGQGQLRQRRRRIPGSAASGERQNQNR